MIAIGCDHAAVELKKEIIKALSEKGFEFKDMGTDGEPCDYPNMAEADYKVSFINIPEGYTVETNEFHFEAGSTEMTIVLKAA